MTMPMDTSEKTHLLPRPKWGTSFKATAQSAATWIKSKLPSISKSKTDWAAVARGATALQEISTISYMNYPSQEDTPHQSPVEKLPGELRTAAYYCGKLQDLRYLESQHFEPQDILLNPAYLQRAWAAYCESEGISGQEEKDKAREMFFTLAKASQEVLNQYRRDHPADHFSDLIQSYETETPNLVARTLDVWANVPDVPAFIEQHLKPEECTLLLPYAHGALPAIEAEAMQTKANKLSGNLIKTQDGVALPQGEDAGIELAAPCPSTGQTTHTVPSHMLVTSASDEPERLIPSDEKAHAH